jgi:hypothetical protein
MRAEIRVTVDKDKLAFTRMRNEGGLWVVTVNSGHVVKMVKARGGVKLDASGCEVPTREEILEGDGSWLIYTRARFIRAAVRIPREKPVDEVVREFEEGLREGGEDPLA